jgi:hypothetical protein
MSITHDHNDNHSPKRHDKVLIVGESRGSTEVLAPLARELSATGHRVEIVATGSSAESVGFADLPFYRVRESDFPSLVRALESCGLLLVGITGSHSVEAKLCAAARSLAVRSIGVLDNVDNLTARFPANEDDYPDLIVLSGQMPGAFLQQRPLPWLMNQNRFIAVDNLRRAAALRRRLEFQRIGRTRILQQALSYSGTFIPGHLDADVLLAEIVLGEARLVVFYSQNISPNSPFWRSYGHQEGELIETFARNQRVALKALVMLRQLPRVHVAIRPHPRESFGTSFDLARELGALYFPPEACHSLDLAIAAGHVVTPAGSMIDQGPFHGVRTAALLFEQNGPFPYESLCDGSVVSAYEAGDLDGVLRLLTADDPLTNAQWSTRLAAASRPTTIAASALESIFNQLHQISRHCLLPT